MLLKRISFVFMVLLAQITFSRCSPGGDVENPDPEPDPDPVVETGFKPEKYIRIVALADPVKEEHWMLNKAHGLSEDYTAQDVLEIIAELKPDCLERFVTGKQYPDQLVPVREGYPEMTTLEFLNAALLAGGDNCVIVPKLNLEWLIWKNPEFFWESAQNLYDLPLIRPIRTINLDVWDLYTKEIHPTEAERDELFRRLRDIGYTEITCNLTGRVGVNHPQLDGACFNIDTERWVVNEGALNTINGYENIKEKFMYIDYPGAMNAFRELTPDRQAEVYTYNIYPRQKEDEFTFVYAIFQDDFDACAVKTSPNSEFKGKTHYEIIRDLLKK